MSYEETYNLILNIAKKLDKPRSFLSILKLLKTNNVSSKIFFDSIKKYYDDIISSFIISRTRLTSAIGVDLFYEREAVATILSVVKIENNDTSVANKAFEQKGLKFKLPTTLDENKMSLVKNIIVANNCIEICRVGNNSDKIYEITFYAKYYIHLDPSRITEQQKEFSETFKFVLDNVLETDKVKQKIIDTLAKHGRLGNIIQDSSIDTIFRVLDREIAAMTVVLKADELNQKIDQNNIYDYVTLWFLSEDFKTRAEKIKNMGKQNNGNTKPVGTTKRQLGRK